MQIICGVGLVFSKETGVFLAAALFITYLGPWLNKSGSAEFRRFLCHTFIIQLVVVVVYLALFKILAPPMNYRYISYDFTLALILKNITYYLLSSPEVAVGLIFSCYWALHTALKLPKKSENNNTLLTFLSFLSFSLIIYFSGICLWRWPLDYYLLPAHLMCAFLIPLTVWVMLPNIKPICKPLISILLGCIALIWLIYFIYRVIVGITIFQFDAVKDNLAHSLSNPDYIGRRIVIPLTHPDNTEVGERLEYFINNLRSAGDAVNLYNFWEPPFLNRQNISRFDNSAGLPPSKDELRRVAKNPENFVIWKFGENEHAMLDIVAQVDGLSGPSTIIENKNNWQSSYLNDGDLIIAPIGVGARLKLTTCAR